MTFSEFALDPALLALLPAGLQNPTPIQQLAIPAALSGQDLLALARTGSGKTLAFGLPLLQGLDPDRDGIQGLVLVPTRELASQVSDALRGLAAGRGLRLVTLCGGVAQELQVAELVATGASNAEIAEELFLAEGTVKNHVSTLLRKLDQRDRTRLALFLSRELMPEKG